MNGTTLEWGKREAEDTREIRWGKVEKSREEESGWKGLEGSIGMW